MLFNWDTIGYVLFMFVINWILVVGMLLIGYEVYRFITRGRNRK